MPLSNLAPTAETERCNGSRLVDDAQRGLLARFRLQLCAPAPRPSRPGSLAVCTRQDGAQDVDLPAGTCVEELTPSSDQSAPRTGVPKLTDVNLLVSTRRPKISRRKYLDCESRRRTLQKACEVQYLQIMTANL